MIGLFILAIAVALGGGLLTRLSPTVDEIKDRFHLAQTYYAAKDYDNGVTIFSEIAETPNRALLNVDTISVVINDLVLPVRVAARYQVGNSLRNMGLDLLARSESALAERDSLLAEQRRAEAVESLRLARRRFADIVDDERAPEHVRVMSQYQIIRAAFAMEDYVSVVEDVARLLEQFPGNAYEEAALYDLAWAHFRMGRYDDSIGTFGRVLRLSRDAVRVDRALFQIGEANAQLGRPTEAQSWYQRLVDKYDFSALSEKDLLAMQTAKIRGVVQETTRELVAKAQIKIGDSHARAGEVDQAIEAYATVPAKYPQEEYLVEQSYTRLAELVLDSRGLDAGIREYQQAILESERKVFQATTQLQIARLLYEAGRYREAIEAYGVYWKGYGDVSRIVGFQRDKVLFKIGEAYRRIGIAAAAAGETARPAFEQALVSYDSTLTYDRTVLRADATFGKGASFQGLGQPDSALAAYSEVVAVHPTHPAVPSSLMQIARLKYEAGAFSESVASYERLIREYREADMLDEARVELGVVYKTMGRPDDALAGWQSVSRDSPSWVKVRVEIGEMLTAAGKYGQAQEQLDEAILEAGDDTEALAALHYIKGKIVYSQQHYSEAVESFTLAISSADNEQIIASCMFLRALSRYGAGKQMDAAGDSAGGRRHYEAAVTDLEQVLEQQITPKMRNISYRTLGTAMTRLGRAVETFHYYEELIASTEDAEERAGFLLLLTELYYDQGRFDETATTSRRLIEERFQDNDDMGYFLEERAYAVLASAELERQRYAEALAAAAEGLSRFPKSGESASLAFSVGLARYFLEEYAEAAVGFERYVADFPGDVRALEGMYYAGQCHQILGDYGVAASWFRMVADTYAGSSYVPEALFLAGENLYNAYEFQRSLDTYEELLERFPDSEYADDAMYSSAWALVELKELEEGVRRMEALVNRYPGSPHAPRAQFTVGDYYYSTREYEVAQETYMRLVSLFPDSDEAARARDLIREVDEEMASRIYEEAVTLYQERKLQLAIELFQTIVDEHPRTYAALAALGNMGVALEEVGEEGRAERAYREVVTRAGADPAYEDVVAFATARLSHL